MTFQIKKYFLGTIIFILVVFFLQLLSASVVLSDDWSSCADDLDRLRRGAEPIPAISCSKRVGLARIESFTNVALNTPL
jgi:hypothetical protein